MPYQDFVPADTDADAEGVVKTLYGGRKTTCPLNIVIIGCGLGGLAAAYCLGQAGHRVTLLESAPALGEVGAGIQVSPNVSRLLIRWGIKDQLDKVAVRPEGISFRRWQDGKTVGYTSWDGMDEEYGAPYYQIHRADFHKLLFDLALPVMTLRLNSTVTDIDVYSESPSCTLASGEVIQADLIIGADGVKSHTRELIVGGPDQPRPTGDAAYRAIISTEGLLKDPELRGLVEHPEMISWMGPERHVIGYNIRGKREYNLVVLHPDDAAAPADTLSPEAGAEAMRKEFADWEPKIQKLFKMVPHTLSWKLMDHAPMETWVHKCGTVVLLGDSCHPMLPYRAQGAAMAIEDAAVIGNMFSFFSDKRQLTPMLRAYEGLRHARASATQASSRMNQKIFHYPDGPEQERRDALMGKAMELEQAIARGERGPLTDEETLNSPNQWADKRKSRNQFSYDADKIVEGWWEARGKREMEAFIF